MATKSRIEWTENTWNPITGCTKISPGCLNCYAERMTRRSDNVWMGVTVENGDFIYRVEHLRKSSAKHKFISFEPLLGSVGELNFKGIDWVIVGGESGPGAMPMKNEWVTEIRGQCIESGIPFFFKQWGDVRKKAHGKQLDGVEWTQKPRCFEKCI